MTPDDAGLAPDKVATGRAIREARKALGITVAELATHLGVSQPYLTQVENGRKALTAERLTATAAHLRVPIKHLIHPDTYPFRVTAQAGAA